MLTIKAAKVTNTPVVYLGASDERKVCGGIIFATQYAEKKSVPVTVFVVYPATLEANRVYIIPPIEATIGIR